MYNIEDLFDKRSIIGTKLEQYLEEKSYTKAKLCEAAGVSRPTLDKLLAGTLTSKTNYEKHISKVLNCLALTPDMLLGKVRNEYSQARAIRNMMRLTSEDISKNTGISLKRLNEIEAGGEAAVAELRDIAFCLSTSVRGLLGTNFFGAQVATMEVPRRRSGEERGEAVSGFWGHIGILPANRETYLWYPITGDTRSAVYQTMDEERMVVPCMNNKVLLLNMQNIKEIALLDEACDQPGFVNWDPKVDCGGIPLVLYEALEDYLEHCYGEEIPDHVLSPKFQDILHRFCKDKGWSAETIHALIYGAIIYFRDGKDRYTEINFYEEETISDEVANIYNFDEPERLESTLCYCDSGGAEIMLNMRNISLLELPLLKIEDAICKKQEEMLR